MWNWALLLALTILGGKKLRALCVIVVVLTAMWIHLKNEVIVESGTVLLTGCSSGIGRHAAFYLAAKGFVVLAVVRKEEDVSSLKEELGRSNNVKR